MEDWIKRDGQSESEMRVGVTGGRMSCEGGWGVGERARGGEGFAKGRTGREQSGCQATDIVPIVAGVA